MTEAKPTPGPYTLDKIAEWPFGIRITSAGGKIILHQQAVAYSSRQKTRAENESGHGFKLKAEPPFDRQSAIDAIAEQDANAEFIHAAFQTYHQIGLTPQQMRDERGRLLHMLSDLVLIADECARASNTGMMDNAIRSAEDLIDEIRNRSIHRQGELALADAAIGGTGIVEITDDAAIRHIPITEALRNPELVELRRCVNTLQPYAGHPIGGEGSPARRRQEEQAQAYARAIEIIDGLL